MSVFLQLLINGLIAGSIYSLVAAGFSLTYSVNKFMNFAHGAMIAFSGYMMFNFFSKYRQGFVLAFLLAILCTAALGLAADFLVYRQLRKRKASTTIQLIASLALLTMINSCILLFFSSDVRSIKIANPVYIVMDARITMVQAVIILTAILMMAVLWLVAFKTKIGKAMRAISDNKEVAQTVGINPEKIYLSCALISSVLAGIGGGLIGIEQNLYPQMGVMLIVKGFAATVMGGLGLIQGTIFGSYLLGMVENFGIWYLPSGYKDAISFVLLFLFLLFRPYGIFGKKRREDVA